MPLAAGEGVDHPNAPRQVKRFFLLARARFAPCETRAAGLGLGAVSRILSPGLRQGDRHFSQIPRGTCPPKLAEQAKEDATYPGLLGGPPSPLFCLAPDWVFPATGIAAGAVGSYPTFSPLPPLPSQT